MDAIGILAVVAVCLVAVELAFQLALAVAAPWAGAAYGGRAPPDHRTLPTRYRVASVVAAVFLLGVPWLILAEGRVIARGPVPDRLLSLLPRVLAGLFPLNTFGTLRARHPLERWGFSGVAAVLAAAMRGYCCQRLADRSAVDPRVS